MTDLWMKPHFPPLSMMKAESLEEGELSSVCAQGLSFEELSFEKTEFSTVKFLGCKFKNCDFYRASFVNVLMENCSFANCRFEGSYWAEVFADDCKLTGCDFTEAVFKKIMWQDVSIQYANFDSAVFRDVFFHKTKVINSELTNCKLQGIKLVEADLSGTNCFKSYFAKTDLTDTLIDGIILSRDFDELKGATISPQQAGGLIKLLGINVKAE